MTLDKDRKILIDETCRMSSQLEEYIYRTNVRQLDEFAFDLAYKESRIKHVKDKFGDLFIVRRYEVYKEVLIRALMAENPERNMLKITMYHGKRK